MITEILLVHHSHTDIGYTHPQPIVFELHQRFIEIALDLAEETADFGDDAKFRWTCEVTGTTRAWWNSASSLDRSRFLAAVRRGQIEVAASEWHLTPLADLRMLTRSLENVEFFRDLGVPIRSAMNTDVNGVPWGIVDVLLDHGIDGFSMSANSHMGGPVRPRPGAFRWQSPDRRELLVWNGFQYWHFANVLLRIPTSVKAVAEAMPALLGEAVRRGYALGFLPVQITNIHHPDNATPDGALSRFVREWNASDPEVRIRTVLLSEVFERLRRLSLPVLSGDWTDYWNFGAGSSARETTVLQDGLRVLGAAHFAGSWPGRSEARESAHLDAAHAALALYAEHTWGADCSISAPESIETRMQWAMKSSQVYEGLAHGRLVLRDCLHRLAARAGGEAQTLLLFNPLATRVKIPVILPVGGLDWALTPGVHHLQRLDGALANLPDGEMAWCDVDIPPLGYRTYPVDSVCRSANHGLEVDAGRLASTRVQMQFGPTGGVRSIVVDGIEFAADYPGLEYGVPILELPAGGSRKEMMDLDFSFFEPAEGWKRNWNRTTTPGELVGSDFTMVGGAAEYRQTFSMVNGDCVQILYRLFSDDPSIDVEVTLDSAGDSKPYSLAVPFNLPDQGQPQWHFDTAGAIVEFDKEQLPDACRHFVTARRFVRMQSGSAAMSIATPDLPLWKFGGMFFAPSWQLEQVDRRPTMLAWLANNYWEVNFLANQSGRTRYRMRLLPHGQEPVDVSYCRALPYAVPPFLHAYRDMGLSKKTSESLFDLDGDGISVESIVKTDSGVLVTLLNLAGHASAVSLRPGALSWRRAWLADLAGNRKVELVQDENGTCTVDLSARGLVGVLLAT